MIFLRKFNDHTSYEAEINRGGVDFKIPNVSYCKNVDDVHFNPYNTVEFYVGNITGTTPQTVKIYTDSSTFEEVQVSKGNKWYSYLLPKDKGLFKIEGNSVKKAVIKTNISYSNDGDIAIIPPLSTVEASFKGSNTSNITDMSSMFNICSNLTSLDVSNFDTRNVTDMSYMFNYCKGLKSLDVSNFNTSNVTNMLSMFGNCIDITSLDVSSFNTSNVTDMSYMFNGCNSLTSLTLSNFNTSNVTYMNNMFSSCSGLTSLDLRNFNISKVTDMSSMFSGCNRLTSLDLSGWNTSNVNLMGEMFKGCSNSLTIRMVGCSSETVEKIQNQLTADGITGAHITTE